MIATIIPVIAALSCSDRCCSETTPPQAACCETRQHPAGAENISIKGDANVMEVALLALDLDTCDRCTNTNAAIEPVVAELRPLLAEAGIDLQFRKTVVKTAEQAVALQFVSSPTIRINGRDIPVELRETRCGDCTTMCGGTASTDCRVWVWRGQEYDEAPRGLIVDAILRAYGVAHESPMPKNEDYTLPENLRQFFDAKRQRADVTERAAPNPQSQRCCDTKTCCKASEKAQCCGNESSEEKGACGCKPQGTANHG